MTLTSPFIVNSNDLAANHIGGAALPGPPMIIWGVVILIVLFIVYKWFWRTRDSDDSDSDEENEGTGDDDIDSDAEIDTIIRELKIDQQDNIED